jgi:hypothetical protein
MYHEASDAYNRDVVTLRRLEEEERTTRVGPAGGVWGSAKPREALREPLPLTAVASAADAKRHRRRRRQRHSHEQHGEVVTGDYSTRHHHHHQHHDAAGDRAPGDGQGVGDVGGHHSHPHHHHHHERRKRRHRRHHPTPVEAGLNATKGLGDVTGVLSSASGNASARSQEASSSARGNESARSRQSAQQGHTGAAHAKGGLGTVIEEHEAVEGWGGPPGGEGLEVQPSIVQAAQAESEGITPRGAGAGRKLPAGNNASPRGKKGQPKTSTGTGAVAPAALPAVPAAGTTTAQQDQQQQDMSKGGELPALAAPEAVLARAAHAGLPPRSPMSGTRPGSRGRGDGTATRGAVLSSTAGEGGHRSPLLPPIAGTRPLSSHSAAVPPAHAVQPGQQQYTGAAGTGATQQVRSHSAGGRITATSYYTSASYNTQTSSSAHGSHNDRAASHMSGTGSYFSGTGSYFTGSSYFSGSDAEGSHSWESGYDSGYDSHMSDAQGDHAHGHSHSRPHSSTQPPHAGNTKHPAVPRIPAAAAAAAGAALLPPGTATDAAIDSQRVHAGSQGAPSDDSEPDGSEWSYSYSGSGDEDLHGRDLHGGRMDGSESGSESDRSNVTDFLPEMPYSRGARVRLPRLPIRPTGIMV